MREKVVIPASSKGISPTVNVVPCPIAVPVTKPWRYACHLSHEYANVVPTAVKLAKFVLVPRWLILMSPLISAFRNGANPACAAPVFGFTYNPLAPAAAM